MWLWVTAWIRSRPRGWWLCAAIAVVAALMFFGRLGTFAFEDYDEATYAEVTAETLASHNLMTLQFTGHPWFEKPPLMFWLAMGSGAVFSPPEFAYRLPSALFGLASVMLVMATVFAITGLYGPAAAAGAILLFSPLFFEAVRQFRLDVPVSAAILAAFYCFVRGQRDRRWLIGIGIAAAVGLMCKSVIIVLAAPAIVVWSLVHRDFAWIASRYFWIGALAGILLVAPWHVYETMQYGAAFWNEYLLRQVLDRAATNVLGGASAGSNATYLYFLFVFALPWTAVCVLVMLGILFARVGANARKCSWALALTSLCICAFFFAAHTKISYYLTPVYPFIAMTLSVAGFALYRALRSAQLKMVFIVAALLVGAYGIANTIYIGYHFQGRLLLAERVAEQERAIGHMIRAQRAPVFTYDYSYWETIRYYGDGVSLQAVHKDQTLNAGAYLILPSGSYAQDPLLQDLVAHMVPLYEGSFLMLVRLIP